MLTVHVESSPSPQSAKSGRAGDPGPATVTLQCHGRLVMGVEAETLRCIVTARTERHVVVDLHHVYGIDAAGLGLLAELHCWARQRAGWLSITRPSPCARRLLSLTALDSVLDIERSQAQAEFIPCERRAMTA
jgi:anti-anti-sigma factor